MDLVLTTLEQPCGYVDWPSKWKSSQNFWILYETSEFEQTEKPDTIKSLYILKKIALQ